MNVIGLILDTPLFRAHGSTPSVSLLTMPLGQGSILDHLALELSEICPLGIMVMATWDTSSDPTYTERVQESTSVPVRVVDHQSFSTALDHCESSDTLVAIDSSCWPVQGYALDDMLACRHDYFGASHFMAIDVMHDSIRERVECDTCGSVKVIRRLYNAGEWPRHDEMTIVCSSVPPLAAVGIRFSSLRELRLGLQARGVPNRDLPINKKILHLEQPGELLALNERTIAESSQQQVRAGFNYRSPGIVVGCDCDIHPTVRIIPPVIIHPRVTIEADAAIVGPALIGSGCTIGKGASVADAVLAEETDVAPKAQIVHQIIAAGHYTSASEMDPPADVVDDEVLFHERINGKGAECLIDGQVDHRKRFYCILKRLVDVLASSVALAILSPLFAVVAVLIKLTSPGPVFFVHCRERRGGSEFGCLKFRTMFIDAHKQQRDLYTENLVDGPQFKLNEDPRVTTLGRVLRSTNIDELPQLINVLLGHMSLVGPRPSPFRENQICVPWRQARLSVPPGITGLWQVCRDTDRSQGDFHEWIHYDIAYVRYFSIWLDFKILLATLATLGGRMSVPLHWLTGRREVVREPLQATVAIPGSTIGRR